MAALNPFEVLGDDDAEDPTLLLTAAQRKAAAALPKKAAGSAQPPAKAAAKLPSKPLPPTQAVREFRNEGQCGGRGAGCGCGEGEEELEEAKELNVEGEEELDEAKELNAEGEEELEEELLEKVLVRSSKDLLTLLIKEAVAKHPDVMEAVNKLANTNPAHCKIFIHGLGWDANTDLITSVFGKYGEIVDCKVVKDKTTGKSNGLILYKHHDGARRALKEPQKMINGRMASCQLACAGPVQTSPQAAEATVQTPPVSDYTQRIIYVRNVSAELDTNKLLEFFYKFGEIEDGPLGLDEQTGKPRGFCLFVYKSAESAKKALEEPHKYFDGHILYCQKLIDGPKHSHFNQQPGQPQQHQHLKRSRLNDLLVKYPVLLPLGALALSLLILFLSVLTCEIEEDIAKRRQSKRERFVYPS